MKNSFHQWQVTVVACVSATGQAIPLFIIRKRKTMSISSATGEIPGTRYGFSDSGWMNSILFDSWFHKQFLRHAPAGRPLLLLLDGHSSHFCPVTIDCAAENGIIIFVPYLLIRLIYVNPWTKVYLVRLKFIGEKCILIFKQHILVK